MSAEAQSRTDFCIFRRAESAFAVSTHLAKEVIEGRFLTPIPHAPPELLGALNLRGEIVPLVTLDPFLSVPGRPLARGEALLILALGDLRFAAAVDRVDSVKHLAPWEIRRDIEDAPPPGDLVRGWAGRAEDRLTVLDGEALIGAVVQRIAEGFRRQPASDRTEE
jgi:chemotaxis signal transduction protein